MRRRQFVGGLAAAAGLAACTRQDDGGAAPASCAGETFEWSIATSWPPKFPGLGVAVNNLADRIAAASGGRLTLKVYSAGELVPAFEAFDAASRGIVEMGHDAAYYHKGKVPAAQFMTAIPFGMTFMEMNAWLYYGGGLELWRELYEPLNLVPFPCGNTGVQMGGWFNKEINSVADLKGLKMRIPGLGGEVFRRAGGTPVTLPVSEIFTSLQTGAIDATEWVGPYNDITSGFHTIAKYYYYPGWQEPAPALQAYVNRQAWESLPPDLQSIIETSCQAITTDMQAEYTHGNAAALQQLLGDPNVELRQFPDGVLQYLKSIAQEIVEEMVANDPMAAKIYESWSSFLAMSIPNQRITEQAFLATRR
ncbi:MAG: ABC transporter substrate-binding protein [Gammaproteobacteria bacterium]|nr:ABC transporter substrate-binding protein [Gammaproteobacteria bacterium]